MDGNLDEDGKLRRELQESNERAMVIMNSIDASIYIADMQTHEILYVNDLIQQSRSQNLVGMKCYMALQGLDSPCEFCTNAKLTDQDGKPTGKYNWEFKNLIDGKWYELTDRAIYWMDGRIVRMEIATDITTRKEAEEKLRKLSMAVEQSPVSIIITNLDGLIEYANPKALESTGYTAGELLGNNPRILKSGETKDNEYQSLWETISSGKEWHGTFHNKRKNGELYWESSTISPIINGEGEITHFMAIKEDLTDLKQTEMKLRKSEEELNYDQEIGRMGNWELNLITNTVKWSKNLFRMVGLEPSEEEFPNEKFLERIHPDDLVVVDKKLQEILHTRNVVQMELRLMRTDGSYAHFDNTVVPVFEGDTLVRLRGSTLDNTQKKEKDELIRKLSMAVTQSPAGIIITDLNANIEYANPAFIRSTGYSWEELKGKNTRIIKSGKTPVMVYHELWENIEAGRSWQGEWMNKKKNGDFFWESVSITPIINEESIITNYLAVKLDITQRKEAERTIRDLNVNLEKRIAERTEQMAEKNTSLLLEIEERKLVELALNVKTTELENFFTVALDLLCIADINGAFLKMNKAWESVLGYPVSQLENSEFMNFVHPDDRQKTIEALKQLSEQKPVVNFINRFRTTEGGYRYLEWRTTPVGNMLYSAARDITDQLRADEFVSELLRLSTKLTGVAVSEIDDALNLALERIGNFLNVDRSYIFEFNTDLGIMNNTFEWCNASVSSEKDGLQEIPLSAFPLWMEHINNNETILIPSVTDIPDDHSELRESLENQGIQSLVAFPLTSDNLPVGFMGLDSVKTKRDFTDTEITTLKVWSSMISSLISRKRNESLLEQSTRKFTSAFHSSSVMMAISGIDDGRYMDVNNEFIETLGFTREELIGKTNLELGLFIDPGLRNHILDRLNHNIPVRKQETQFRTKDGTVKTGLLSADIIPIGDIRCLLTVTMDITDRKMAEQEILRARMEAEKANLAKSEFLSRMSHELRTPMNSILGFAQLLDMGELAPGQKKGIRHIINSGRHLLELINEVLDITRIEAGRLSLSIEPIQINGIIHEILEVVQPMANERNISLGLEFTSGENTCVKADRQRLKQVLLNLINNAIKYNREGGSIIISTEIMDLNDRNYIPVRIAVSDTGPGISEEDVPRLFTPFERIGAEKTGTEGSGLGLTVVKKLVDAMEGTVGISSVRGKGSKFWIELPVSCEAKPDFPHGSDPEDFHLNEPVKTGKILYIEDNLPNIELVKQIIDSQRFNIEVITTTHGSMALPMAVIHRPDLILLDLNLPDIHGSEVIGRLLNEEMTKNIPVVVISADAMPSQLEKLKKAGARHYLTKPIDVRGFLQILDKFLSP